MAAQLGTRLIDQRRNNTAMARAFWTTVVILPSPPSYLSTPGHPHGHATVHQGVQIAHWLAHCRREADSVFDLFNTALGGILGPYSTLMRGAGLCPFPAKPAHGRLLLLLSTERDSIEVDELKVEVAVVQMLTDPGLDELTGCRNLTVPAARGDWLSSPSATFAGLSTVCNPLSHLGAGISTVERIGALITLLDLL
ncbi:unnamed protein product [Closterium sp. NIES-53]